nr:hypothetical protein [Vibrio splendidus]MCC4880695.1 hypothetical protein [Vibrio splendidus]
MPMIGDEVSLGKNTTFTVIQEYRNREFLKNYAAASGTECDIHFNPIALPKNTVLKVDRIYLRKGAEDFDSVTFIMKSHPKFKNLKGRFFVSMELLQGLAFEHVNAKDKGKITAKGFVNDIKTKATKQYMIDNVGSSRWEARDFEAEKVSDGFKALPLLESYSLEVNITEKIKAYIDAMKSVDMNGLSDRDNVNILDKVLKVSLAKLYLPILEENIGIMEDPSQDDIKCRLIDRNGDYVAEVAKLLVKKVGEDTIYEFESYPMYGKAMRLDGILESMAKSHGHNHGWLYDRANLISLTETACMIRESKDSHIDYTTRLFDHKGLLAISIDDALSCTSAALLDSKGNKVPSLKKELIKIRKSIRT